MKLLAALLLFASSMCFGATSTVKNKQFAWSGYHDATCSWPRTNTAYGDPTADATCVLVERLNKNFGTVVTYAGPLPGIVFTPKVVGLYWVCASVSTRVAVSSDAAVKLHDGTITIAEANFSASAGAASNVPVCGLYNVTSLSSITFSVQSKVSTGTVTLAPFAANTAIEWTLFLIN